jgi:hypothetical protein
MGASPCGKTLYYQKVIPCITAPERSVKEKNPEIPVEMALQEESRKHEKAKTRKKTSLM